MDAATDLAPAEQFVDDTKVCMSVGDFSWWLASTK